MEESGEMKSSKKSNRRSKVKYPALDPKYNLKSRGDLLECDYLDQLSEKDKEWLNSFNEEYVNANFSHKGTTIQKTKAYRKDSYDRNNARNRDILTREHAMGHNVQLDDNVSFNPEKEIVEKMDREIIIKKLKKT